MPIVGIKCEVCCVDVPFADIKRHFSTCASVGAPFVDALTSLERSDVRHRALAVTTTAATDCPRRAYLSRTEEVYVKLPSILPRLLGSALHHFVSQAAEMDPEEWIVEVCTCADPLPVADAPPAGVAYDVVEVDGEYHERSCHKARCTFKGSIASVHLSGRVDAIHFLSFDDPESPRAYIDLYDWKFTSAFNARHIDPTKPKDAYVTQAVVNAELARQNGYNVRVVHFGVVPWYTYVSVPVNVQAMSLETVLSTRPHGGDVTAREIITSLDEAYRGERPFLDLPAAGTTMMRDKRGKGMCDKFCEYAHACPRDVSPGRSYAF